MTVYPVPVYLPPTDCDDRYCRDMFLELVYIVVIPGSVVLLLVLLLSLILCCSCTRRTKKSTSLEDIDLEKYNSIRRASRSLRDLSQKRDVPLSDNRRSSLTLERDHRYRRGVHSRGACQSAPGTLQRDRKRREDTHSISPPPYQMPPEYTVNGSGTLDRSHQGHRQDAVSENEALIRHHPYD